MSQQGFARSTMHYPFRMIWPTNISLPKFQTYRLSNLPENSQRHKPSSCCPGQASTSHKTARILLAFLFMILTLQNNTRLWICNKYIPAFPAALSANAELLYVFGLTAAEFGNIWITNLFKEKKPKALIPQEVQRLEKLLAETTSV